MKKLDNNKVNLNLSNKDVSDFMGKNSKYYLNKFEFMQNNNKIISWNWAAFFLSFYWVLYRKMYLIGFTTVSLYLMFGMLPVVGFILDLGIIFYFGLFGNSLYYKHINKELDMIKDLKYHKKDKAFAHKGGTNIFIPVILFIFTLITVGFFRLIWYMHF